MQAIDRKTRKLFTIYEGLDPKSDVDRLYIPRKDGGSGLIAIENYVELAVRGLEVYVHEIEEKLLQAARGDRVDGLEVASVLKKAKKEKRLQDWEEKVLDGWGGRQLSERSLIVAAQNHSMRLTKARKTHYVHCVGKPIKVYIMLLVVVANLHSRSIKEGMITYVK